MADAKNTTAVEDEESYLEGINFSEGADAASDAAKSSGTSKFARLKYLDQMLDGSEAGKAKGENYAFIRYLTDYISSKEDDVLGWITVDYHRAVPTKPKPASEDADRAWPKAMSCVCRNGRGFKERYGDCWVCLNVEDKFKKGKKHQAKPRTFAVGVLREPVLGDGTEENGGPRSKGKIIGFTDVTVEVAKVDEDGEIIEGEFEVVPQYVIMSQAWDNYFKALNQFADNYGTALDRDYKVIRDGDDKDTDYLHVAMDPIDIDLGDGPVRLDLRDKSIREALYGDMPDLRKMLARQASTAYFSKWFVPGDDDDAAPAEQGEEKGSAATKKSATVNNADRMAALRERLKSKAGTAKSED